MIAIVIFLPFILWILFTFYLFDRVVKFEFGNYRKYWIADGKPIGFFWVPEEARGEFLRLPKISSSIKRTRFASRWIYTTPSWARGDAQAKRILLQYKLTAIFPLVAFLVWIIFVFIK
ncbi:MAG TPA: hypothetical protein VGB68_20870 [Pyrinomonadaceae bacterium]|jgi:hypothetical protein